MTNIEDYYDRELLSEKYVFGSKHKHRWKVFWGLEEGIYAECDCGEKRKPDPDKLVTTVHEHGDGFTVIIEGSTEDWENFCGEDTDETLD